LNQEVSAQLLDGYRVLDMTEEGYMLCGKILGDMGAEVIKIEKPQGSFSRLIGPFYHDEKSKEKSLYWFSYNTNKKGVTLNIEAEKGRELFLEIVKKSDFLLESFAPGYLKKLELDYDCLHKINPSLIMVSMTPFGQTGPYAEFPASDIVTWALGGMLYGTGFPENEPLWFGYPQSKLNAGAEGAAASLIALWCRNFSGKGQHVDVSEQECVIWLTYIVTMIWDLNKRIHKRDGNNLATGTLPLKIVFPCKDGHVCLLLLGGGNQAFCQSSINLVQWMKDEGKAPPWLLGHDWSRDYDPDNLQPDLINKVNEAVTEFLMTKTKKELYYEGFKRKVLVAPINNVKDILDDEQLQSRMFWQKKYHPELREELTYCGSIAKISDCPLQIKMRAPLLGEHNKEIYQELGLTHREMADLQAKGII